MNRQLNQFGQAVSAAGTDARYDAQARNLLSNRPFLAWILKYTTIEFASFTPDEIIPYIDNDPKVASVAVFPGETNRLIDGLPQESNIPSEGKLAYDIRFFAKIPGTPGVEEFSLIIDVEMQNDPYPGYDLVSRGILYCGRMLSEQMGRNVSKREDTNKYLYKNLQKVYSIWIVMNCAQQAANTISKYGITHESLYGEFVDHARSDLMNVVMIRLPVEGKEKKAVNRPMQLHAMLSTIFSQTLSVKERLSRLEHGFGITVTEKIRREITDMCNLSQGIRQSAMDEKTRDVAERMIRRGQISDSDIADYTGLSLDQVKALREEMNIAVMP